MAYALLLAAPALMASNVVIGRAVGIHIADEVITKEGRVDVARIRPLARLGYNDYASVDQVFEIAAHADLPGPRKERDLPQTGQN